jgi:hypothetical protein
MRQSLLVASLATLVVLFTTLTAHADANVAVVVADGETTLTPLEMKWLRAGWPVLSYADEQHLPIDIVVRPQAVAGEAPFAMGVENGRCKLVLSMRGNPEAESPIASLPAELQGVAIEAMTAHEVAHCWRYMNGQWHTLPAGFIQSSQESTAGVASDGVELATLQQAMRDTRREEGFADLVGLAWILRAHPEQYAAIHTWFEQVRASNTIEGSHHDTRIWLRLAALPENFSPGATPFAQANVLWTQALTEREVKRCTLAGC